MNTSAIRLSTFGVRVGTRTEGRQARDVVLQALRDLTAPGRLDVLLDGLDVLSGSFADEALAIPYGRLASGEYGDRYMVAVTQQGELVEDLAYKLERRGLVMLCALDKQWKPLGDLPPEMEQTLQALNQEREVTARQMADMLGIRHNTCLHRLARLTELRLIRREQIGRVGPHPTYRFHTIV